MGHQAAFHFRGALGLLVFCFALPSVLAVLSSGGAAGEGHDELAPDERESRGRVVDEERGGAAGSEPDPYLTASAPLPADSHDGHDGGHGDYDHGADHGHGGGHDGEHGHREEHLHEGGHGHDGEHGHHGGHHGDRHGDHHGDHHGGHHGDHHEHDGTHQGEHVDVGDHAIEEANRHADHLLRRESAGHHESDFGDDEPVEVVQPNTSDSDVPDDDMVKLVRVRGPNVSWDTTKDFVAEAEAEYQEAQVAAEEEMGAEKRAAGELKAKSLKLLLKSGAQLPQWAEMALEDAQASLAQGVTQEIIPAVRNSEVGYFGDGAILAYAVEGAGGNAGELCNGLYRIAGARNGRTYYRRDGGGSPAVIYYDGFWKMECRGRFDGWHYSASDLLGNETPPEGKWSTFGYTGRDDVDPPPLVAKFHEPATDLIPADAICPWSDDPPLHTGHFRVMRCYLGVCDPTLFNGGVENSSSCCSKLGGVYKCPKGHPYQCAFKNCTEDHCCVERPEKCKFLGGPRPCQGPVGLPGHRGYVGLTGPEGDTGFRGPHGPKGLPGPQGPPGEPYEGIALHRLSPAHFSFGSGEASSKIIWTMLLNLLIDIFVLTVCLNKWVDREKARLGLTAGAVAGK